jgi:hypothetical protein
MKSAVQPYGPPINDALKNPDTSLATLVALRARAASILKSQGNLKAAVARLDQEIQRRKKAASATKAKAKK